jgi:hypothetical protein
MLNTDNNKFEAFDATYNECFCINPYPANMENMVSS